MEAEEEHEGQVFTGQLIAFLPRGSRGDVSEATAKTAVTGETLGRRLPKRQWPGKHLESDRQNGSDLENAWEATAKTAVTGKTVGKQPPKRQWPGRYLGSNRQNGSDWENTWEATA